MTETEKDILRKVARLERALYALLVELGSNASTHDAIAHLSDYDSAAASILRLDDA